MTETDTADARSLQARVIDLLDLAVADQWGSAASAVVSQGGRILARYGVGTLARVDEQGEPLDAPPADGGTWFDLASVTKVFSAVTLLTLVEQGVLDLDAPISRHLPSFAEGDRGRVSLRHLLSHTAGLPPEWHGWRGEDGGLCTRDRAEALAEITTLPLEHAPGTVWQYSCVGYLVAMAAAEQATGRTWRELVQTLVLDPLALGDGIGFEPGGPVAATEGQPRRGLISGVVHDETAWTLGGAVANAGLFGTADGLARFGEAILRDELPCPAASLTTNALPVTLGRDVADPDLAPWGHGLGLRLGQQDWMVDPAGVGHTGFTGTSLLIVPSLDLTVALLTNAVHPQRRDGDVHRVRRSVHQAALAAISAGA